MVKLGSRVARPDNNKQMEMSLAVEHKIFFNEQNRNEFERNKLIIAKADKRKKGGLLHDKALSTDFEKAIVYEAFDLIYTECLPLSDQTTVKTQILVEIIKGRMSTHKILKASLQIVKATESAIQESTGEVALGSNEVVETIFSQELPLY